MPRTRHGNGAGGAVDSRRGNVAMGIQIGGGAIALIILVLLLILIF